MIIFAIRGNQDTFKTKTIGRFLELAKDSGSGFDIVQDRKRQGSHDFYGIIRKNGVLIGLCSYGDTSTLIKKYCDALKNAGCTIIVAACHPKGKTVAAVESYNEFGFEIRYLEKSHFPNESTIESDALILLSRINELVKNQSYAKPSN